MKETYLLLFFLFIFSVVLFANLSDSLLVFYPFNGNANDESGNEHHGTVYGSSLTFDRFGNENQAYQFDGTNDYIALDMHYESGNSIEKCTFVGWYKTSFSGSDYMSNWSFLDFDRSEWLNFYIRADNGKLAFSGADGINDNFDIYANTASNDGQWHMGVVIFDSENNVVKFYLDGNLDGVVNYTNIQPITDTLTRYAFIGDGSEATTFNGTRNNFNYEGAVDDIRFYNRILSEDEIHELYFQSNFTASRTVASVSDEIQFTSATYGNPTSWEWDFDNDGIIDSYEENPTWSYSALGNYTVSLTVSDGTINHTTTKEEFILISDNPLVEGLFAYYPFNGNTNDESGNEHNAIANDPILAEDRFAAADSAYYFDGIDDYIFLLNDEQADSLSLNFSVSVWFKSLSSTGDSEARVITRDRSDYWAIFVNQSQSFPQDLIVRVDNSTDHILTDKIEEDSWYLVTLTWNSTTYETQLYINNELITTYPFYGFTGSSRPIIIGANTEENPNPSTTPFYGMIDDIRIYNRILVNDEIKEIYHENAWPIFPDFYCSPRYGTSPFEVNFTDQSRNATAWEWDFDDDGIIDSSEQNPQFIYTNPGVYTVKLVSTFETVKDSISKISYIVVQDAILSAPQNPTITLTGSNVDLGWEPVVNADYYLIYFSKQPYTSFEYLAYTEFTSYSHHSATTESKEYFYQIIGFDGDLSKLNKFIQKNPFIEAKNSIKY